MTSEPGPVSTPWRDGPFHERRRDLLFGVMYEDSGVELQIFAPCSRVFCIAAAGCTARALAAAGHKVTAVDINPEQVAYAQMRAAGGPPQTGRVERMMSLGRKMMVLCGWTRSKLAEFLSLDDTSEQLAYWDEQLNTRRWRWVVDTFLSPRILGMGYSAAFIRALPVSFGKHIRDRLRRGWEQFSNATNPYAAALLLGVPSVEYGRPLAPITFACADAAEFLETCPPGSFDAFTLSNIGDAAPPEYLVRLQAAVQRSAAQGAMVLTRTFAEPNLGVEQGSCENLVSLDRSLLWGQVKLSRLEGSEACSIF